MDIIGEIILIEFQITTCKCETQFPQQNNNSKQKIDMFLWPFLRVFVLEIVKMSLKVIHPSNLVVIPQTQMKDRRLPNPTDLHLEI